MKPIIASLFAIGWIDILNPAGISIVMLLVPIVKKRWHALLFVIFAYIAYALGGIGIFFGVDKFLKDFYIRINNHYPVQMSIAKLVLGIICIVGFILMVIYLVKAAVQHRELSMNDMLKIKSVSPIFIILLAFGSTWSELFTCVTLLGFIGVLIANSVTLPSAIGLIFIYCIFSLIPTLGVYILYFLVTGDKLQKILNVIRKIMTTFCFYCIPVIFAIGAVWGLKEGISGLL